MPPRSINQNAHETDPFDKTPTLVASLSLHTPPFNHVPPPSPIHPLFRVVGTAQA